MLNDKAPPTSSNNQATRQGSSREVTLWSLLPSSLVPTRAFFRREISKGIITYLSLFLHRGIGLAIARRLLVEITRPLRLCLACRNMEKAEAARQQLLREHPETQIDLLKVDVGQPQSAIAAAREIKKR